MLIKKNTDVITLPRFYVPPQTHKCHLRVNMCPCCTPVVPPLCQQLETAVCALPGIASCAITRLPPTASGASGDEFADNTTNHGAPLHLLVAKRTPSPASAAAQKQRPPATSKSPSSGGPEADVAPGVGRGDNGGGGGGGGGASFGGGPAGADDAVWEALQEAYDARGRRRRSGGREVLEAVRGLGYGARVAAGGGGSDASAVEASQVWFLVGWGWGWGRGRGGGLREKWVCEGGAEGLPRG